MHAQRLTAIIELEDDGYVALCPELDVSSQGDTIEEARANLQEALTLFFETAEPLEVNRRLRRQRRDRSEQWTARAPTPSLSN